MPNTRRLDKNAQLRRAPDIDNPRCRADQCDRVLTGVKARRCATPPLRGAAALTPAPRTVTGNLARQPENHSSRKEELTFDALNEPGAGTSRYEDGFDSRDGSRQRGVPFHVATGVPFVLAISSPRPGQHRNERIDARPTPG